jgi:hypothetical protein
MYLKRNLFKLFQYSNYKVEIVQENWLNDDSKLFKQWQPYFTRDFLDEL